MRILYFSEALVPPFDEGIKKASAHLLRALQAEHEVLALTSRGSGIPEAGVEVVPANRLLLSAGLRRRIRRFRPQKALYLPTACATLASFVRARLLSLYAGAPVELIALQPRTYGRLARAVIPLLRAGPVWAQGGATAASLAPLGCHVRRLPPAVDTETFAPGDPGRRGELRTKYGVPQDAFVALHIGHIAASRNIPALLPLQQSQRVQLLLVGSTAFGANDALMRQFHAAGARVITEYVPHVEELYQLADCYLFPVQSATGSIEVPLSVLEAMACNLPVISTPFGELPRLFPEGDGLHYYRGEAELIAAVERVRGGKPVRTRGKVETLTWTAVARTLISGPGGAP